MKTTLTLTGDKAAVFAAVEKYLGDAGFRVADKDFNRPWGGFFVLDEAQAKAFADLFFPDIELDTLRISGKLSPKILMVQPDTRLSWQYHFRRAEIWKLVAGTAGVVTSETDEQGSVQTLALGEVIRLRQGQRHRLVGLNGWGMIAEIWQHTDAANPSDESDIVRVQDDFGR
ncbi:phosphoheptose isomerase [Chryseolinea lacunae]|uniref:Phosphoheptose isomerase n=1 Tax=Chryseolinea lacunae TaxID=2801331 RepID=A0ABS1KK72_9BACT|nr:phosphoheptose isomerase [Chryseolinea lacunae]MBL0739760.1 phosphoheptose isomerase [Chryseolinea lacunae]